MGAGLHLCLHSRGPRKGADWVRGPSVKTEGPSGSAWWWGRVGGSSSPRAGVPASSSASPECLSSPRSVEGEYVPMEGDEVTYKMCSIPPKNEKLQAVEVVITHLAPGTKHETWSGHVVSS